MGDAKTLFALVTLLIVVAGSAFGQSIESNDRLLRLSPYFNTQHPIGNGPFPSIVIVAGCSGFHNARFSESYERDEERLLKLGYAVTRADFLRPHGIDNSCAGELADAEIAEYITSTVEHVAGIKNVDPNRVYLFGYSLGGTGILTALSHSEIASKIVAVLNYFPRCTGVNTWTARIPMLLMLAELDNIVPPQICKDLVHRVDQPEFIKVDEYPDAHHCFIAKDTPIVTERRTAPTCAYNPQALASSWMDIVDFLESK